MQKGFGANIVALACITLALACSAADSDRVAPGAEATSTAAAPSTSADARAVVERRYRQHLAAGQGISVDTLRARQAWFTPQLYQLMLADMSPTGEIGYIEADPFTDAQDDAASFTVGRARPAAPDTVLVDVVVAFPPATASGHERREVTLVMVPGRGGWQIANFVYPGRDLASGLKGAAPPS